MTFCLSSSEHNHFLASDRASMTIDPEKGIHIGTATASVLGILAQSIYACFFLPSLPYMIQIYFPGVLQTTGSITYRST